MRTLLALAALAGVAGCAALAPQQRTLVWDKPGVTQQQFAQDRYACIQAAQSPFVENFNLTFGACMEAKGYTSVLAQR